MFVGDRGPRISRTFRYPQVRNQLGKPPGGCEEFSEGAPNFLNYVQHIFPGGRKIFQEGQIQPCAHLVTGLDIPVVSMLVLHLKATESFLETSHSALKNTRAWKYRRIRITRCEKAGFIRNWRRSGLKNPVKPNIFIKKNVRMIRTTSFIWFWRTSGFTEVYC